MRSSNSRTRSRAGRFAATMRDHSAAWGLHHAASGVAINAALLLLLALVVICVLPAQSRALPMLSAGASGQDGVALNQQLTAADFTPVTVTQTQTPTSITLNASGFSLLNNALIPGSNGFNWVGSAASSATVVVGYGTIGVQAFAGEALTPISVGGPSIPPFSINPYNAAASSFAAGSVQDSFTLHDPSLPLGAPVVFLLNSNTDANISGMYDPFTTDAIAIPHLVVTGSFGLTGLFGSNVCIGGSPRQCLFESGQTLGLNNFQVTGQNGEVVSLQYSLSVGVTNNPIGTAYDVNFLDPRNATVDALHTMTVNIDPVTAGLLITSESGHDYSMLAPPVTTPEPSTWLLFGSGLVGLILWRKWPA